VELNAQSRVNQKVTVMGKSAGSGKQFWRQPADQRVPPDPNSAYFKKECDYCQAKAIYHWKKKATCRDHKYLLEAALKRDSLNWEARFGKYNRNRSLGV
jgi:hypothetical protein